MHQIHRLTVVDSDKSGIVTYNELLSVLEIFNTNLDNSDINGLMQTQPDNNI